MPGRRPVPQAVAFPERSLTYVPLLLALGRAGDAPPSEPPLHLVPLLRSGGPRVAEAVASGDALAGALPLADVVAAVQAGVPLVVFGALTRRHGGQLVVARQAPVTPRADALLQGAWSALRVGLQTGSTGSERLVRLWLLAEGGDAAGALAGSGSPSAHLTRDPWAGEPRWIGYSTGEGLVAALKDGRIAAFIGPSWAAAQAMILGLGEVVANFSDGSTAGAVSAALPAVLATRRERLVERQSELAALRAACARAGAALSGDAGPALVTHALRERDPLVLRQALRLDVSPPLQPAAESPPAAPSAAQGIYAVDGRLPLTALERYLELAAAAGWTPSLDPASLLAP